LPPCQLARVRPLARLLRPSLAMTRHPSAAPTAGVCKIKDLTIQATGALARARQNRPGSLAQVCRGEG